jgi:hypothetical protein
MTSNEGFFMDATYWPTVPRNNIGAM